MPPKYTLDTNLFIDAFRDPSEEARLVDFYARFAPAAYLNAVVALELRAGASGRDIPTLERRVFAPFETRGRLFAPAYATWKRAGAALAALRDQEGLPLRQVTRAFYNDLLLAASCRGHGVTLVTRNVRDFARIERVLRFDCIPAWP